MMETRKGFMAAQITCGVCGTQAVKQFRRLSYEKGVVVVECPGCGARHVLADHLGWGLMDDQEGNPHTVEDVLAAKGKKVMYGKMVNGTVVILDDELKLRPDTPSE